MESDYLTSRVEFHHVALFARSPERSARFYSRTLGLRLTEGPSPDDPATWWQTYRGPQGFRLELFFYPRCQRGIRGRGSVQSLQFAISKGSSHAWSLRLNRPIGPGGALSLTDPDGFPVVLLPLFDSHDGQELGGLVGLSVDRCLAGVLGEIGWNAEREESPPGPVRAAYQRGYGAAHHLALGVGPDWDPPGGGSGWLPRPPGESSYISTQDGFLLEFVRSKRENR